MATKPKRKVKGAKLGRPTHLITDQNREMVKVMVAAGVQYPFIAGVLRINERTLRRHYKPELEFGAAEVNLIVIAAHLKQIKAGDTRAIEWWERARMGWSDRSDTDLARLSEVPMRVIVELVGEAPPTIDHAPRPRRPFDPAQHVELVG